MDQIDVTMEVMGICEDLETAGLFPQVLYACADYTNWPESLDQYKALILPERVLLDKAHAQKIRDYAANGGKLIAFGHASCLNEKGEQLLEHALADVYAFRETRRDASGGKLTFNSDVRQKYFANETFETLTQITGIIPGPKAEVIASINDNAGVPAVVSHKFGSGHSYYIACGEAAFRGNNVFWRGLRKLAAGEPSFEVVNGGVYRRSGRLYFSHHTMDKELNRYCIVLNESPQGKVLHIIDRIAAVSNVTVKIDASALGSVKGAKKIESDEIVEIERTGDRIQLKVACDPVASVLLQ
jgi:hypothetical protein